MGMNIHAYVGYYLKVSPPLEEYYTSSKVCLNCDKIHYGAEFCPSCGARLVSRKKTRMVRLDIYEGTNGEFTDLELEGYYQNVVFVIPNKDNLGGEHVGEYDSEYAINTKLDDSVKEKWDKVKSYLESRGISFQEKTGMLWYWA